MKIILIGALSSKRTIYLKKAAETIGVSVHVITWQTVWNTFYFNKENVYLDKKIFEIHNLKENELSYEAEIMEKNIFRLQGSENLELNCEDRNTEKNVFQLQEIESLGLDSKGLILKQDGLDLEELKGAVIKIDPPSYETVQLGEMRQLLDNYQNNLRGMMQVPCQFLNTPEMIWKLLDKKETKLQLQSYGVPVTKMFDADIQNMEQLLKLMKDNRCYSVFVKPRYFSGAAGVTAFRIHPLNGKMRMYTSCRMDGSSLVNTKKLVALEEKQEIISFMERLLELGCVVERWYPKAEFEGKSYDLRVVYQFGHIAHIVVRQSAGPITNLHLNNHATDIKRLGLSQEKFREIEDVCKQAMEVFPGLNMAGIDIMLEKGTLRPLVIEMNGQGDLIYQDIYEENRIYAEQIEWMMNC